MKALVLAYYLPQYHEVEENNLWWGKGFTEWTNINNCKKYFASHQIRKPIAPLSQYNLLESGIIEKQFEIANNFGIDGFLIWNYWFGNGEKLLEKPLDSILENKINVKYCLAWANHSWMNKSKGLLLKEQKYLGVEDYIEYFNYLLPHFKSDNYLKIKNKPIFSIFSPKDVTDLDIFMETFERLAKEFGFDGIHWLAENTEGSELYINKFNNFYNSGHLLYSRRFRSFTYFLELLHRKSGGRIKLGPFVYSFKKLDLVSSAKKMYPKQIPVIFTGWDSSIRHNDRGIILNEFNEETFDSHLNQIMKHALQVEAPILILKSWNEWAEGNLIEPDSIFGYRLLEILKKSLNS
ncbi:glycoside hydrolase family 99-like domain-containing protein [Acinetobacter baumannii]|nr:glycoside hydrolase family 99-like domain-containing protein [Acinetobacter baumannii]MCT9281815.1 glycoside hydrolase family 99-like domain-containing protein [Acinetobacter baumannii]MDA5023531.1 glycoside hydrolase family 99-like domain-containing protein [Acinetobacter baumannii]MDO7415280.1 glycoside hydrolase family 99-like domain-containing protein [Acinetobacter baumannii]OTK95192.1 hypothetical protein B9X85_05460 [Acinetobacter baumannii]HAV5535580.1 hypothetical protein [Acinetob